MTTLSAGAAAGLLVALMVVATGDTRGAELLITKPGADQRQPGTALGFNIRPLPASTSPALSAAR